MDLAGMTVPEKLDILYAGAMWLNDDGTTKDNYEQLQQGHIGSYIKEHGRLIEDLLQSNTQQEMADSIKIKLGTFTTYFAEMRRSNENQDQPRRRKPGRKPSSSPPTIVKSTGLTFIQTLEQERIDVMKEIELAEKLIASTPLKKKIIENIDCLIKQYSEIENDLINKAVVGDKEFVNNDLIKVVENVEH